MVIIAFENILYKKAMDKEGRMLGKLIRIDKLPGSTEKIDVPYAIIHVKQMLKIDVKIARDKKDSRNKGGLRFI